MTQPAFTIRITQNGIRVLIIKEEHINKSGLPEYDKFDAMLFKCRDEHIIEHQYMVFNPIIEKECMYKPTFFHPEIQDKQLRYLCDGFALKFSDPVIEIKTKQIQDHIKDIGLKLTPHKLAPGDISIIISIFHYMLMRSEVFPDFIFQPGSPWGYTLPIFSYFISNKLIRIESVGYVMMKFIREYNYMEIIELIDIIHVCPKCFNSHLLFTEVCPKCNKADITEEDVIHHFPCANISPEASYLKGDKLICPKCRKELRHIGIDYDRPMGVYTCYKCDLSFSQPAMRVTCVNCGNVTTPDMLKDVRINKLKFSALGIKAYSKGDNTLIDDLRRESQGIEERSDKYYEFEKT